MILQLCCIYDKRAKDYGAPMAYPTLAVAERAFGDTVNNPGNIVNKHPEDFAMHHIGQFDTETSVIRSAAPVHLFDAMQLSERVERIDTNQQ